MIPDISSYSRRDLEKTLLQMFRAEDPAFYSVFHQAIRPASSKNRMLFKMHEESVLPEPSFFTDWMKAYPSDIWDVLLHCPLRSPEAPSIEKTSLETEWVGIKQALIHQVQSASYDIFKMFEGQKFHQLSIDERVAVLNALPISQEASSLVVDIVHVTNMTRATDPILHAALRRDKTGDKKEEVAVMTKQWLSSLLQEKWSSEKIVFLTHSFLSFMKRDIADAEHFEMSKMLIGKMQESFSDIEASLSDKGHMNLRDKLYLRDLVNLVAADMLSLRLPLESVPHSMNDVQVHSGHFSGYNPLAFIPMDDGTAPYFSIDFLAKQRIARDLLSENPKIPFMLTHIVPEKDIVQFEKGFWEYVETSGKWGFLGHLLATHLADPAHRYQKVNEKFKDVVRRLSPDRKLSTLRTFFVKSQKNLKSEEVWKDAVLTLSEDVPFSDLKELTPQYSLHLWQEVLSLAEKRFLQEGLSDKMATLTSKPPSRL